MKSGVTTAAPVGAVLVTGACGGIGRAVAHRLARDGYRVLAVDQGADQAEDLASKLPGSGHRGLRCDVSVETDVEALFTEAGRVEGAVLAAGVLRLRADGSRAPLAETSLADFEEHMSVNARGTFLCLRAYLQQWSAGSRPERGRVVTFASVAAQLGGYRSSASYIASKGAILALTKAAAREAAPLGITVNAVAPGLIDAPMLRMSLPLGQEAAAAAAIPLNRIGSPEDVAGAVAFLMSDDSAYMTGGVLDINGGYRMQ
jgi:3-oxoacyl-[acyl-carrier protein] reductase